MNLKIVLIYLSFLFVVSGASAQTDTAVVSPYGIKLEKEIPLLATGVSMSAIGWVATQALEPRQLSDLSGLSDERLLTIDRKSTRFFSDRSDKFSDLLAGGSMALPLLLAADKNIRHDAKKVGVLLTETMTLTYGLTLVTKRTVLRNRPYVFNEKAPQSLKLAVESRLSYFSGHTAMSASAAFFTAQVWADYHPDSRWKPLVWTAAAAIPAVTGYLRIRSGEHYFTDVATGYAVGALVGVLVPRLHKIERGAKRKFRFSSAVLDGYPVFVVRGLL